MTQTLSCVNGERVVDVEIFSRELRTSMISERTYVALDKLIDKKPLLEGDKKAVENATRYVDRAITGSGIFERSIPGYDIDEYADYDIASGFFGLTREDTVKVRSCLYPIRDCLQKIRNGLEVREDDLRTSRRFFDEMCEYCLYREEDYNFFLNAV